MVDNFKQAKRILRTGNSKANIQAVNGCCYGQENQPDKGDYLKLCGQEFWEFISGNERLFVEIVEPLGYRAKERNEEFYAEYSRILNLFTQEFMDAFCVNGIREGRARAGNIGCHGGSGYAGPQHQARRRV